MSVSARLRIGEEDTACTPVGVKDIFEALPEWTQHEHRCYCSACEVLKPVFREWTRIAQETSGADPGTVPQETELPAPQVPSHQDRDRVNRYTFTEPCRCGMYADAVVDLPQWAKENRYRNSENIGYPLNERGEYAGAYPLETRSER